MRILGERSLVSFLKLIIDVAYWIVVVAAVVLILAILPIAVLQPEGVNVELPARFELDSSVFEISSRQAEARSIRIEEAEGNVVVQGVDTWEALQGFAAGVVLLAVAVFVLHQFRGIFRSLKAGRPFAQANVRRIRVLGLTLMLGEVVRAAVVAWSSGRIGQSFTSQGIRFQPDFDPKETFIFAGLVVLVLAEVFREAAAMKRDLDTAREIQFGLVPAEEFRQDRITVRSHMRPANTVGGDYYDVVPLGDGKLAVVQADVAGKGMPAALLMAVLQGSLRALLSAGLRGRRLVGALNDYLHDNTPSNRMVTLFYGELDSNDGTMVYVNAGHNRPFLIRRDGSLDRPGQSSMVLGILPDRGYEESTIRLEPGDRLLLYTDGVSEATDAKDAEYGDERVARYLERPSSSTTAARDLVEGLARDVLAFSKPASPGDDMTLTLICRE